MTTAPVSIHPATLHRLPRLRRLALPIGISVGFLVALAVAPLVPGFVAEVRAELAALDPPATVTPPLPREWRWELKPVAFESMIRDAQHKPSPWIRSDAVRERAERPR